MGPGSDLRGDSLIYVGLQLSSIQIIVSPRKYKKDIDYLYFVILTSSVKVG